MSKHLLYFLIINTLIAFLLSWNAYIRYNDFRDHHVALATESVKSLSLEISDFIEERQRLVAIFAREHADIISQLATQPDNEKLETILQNKLSEYFPELFTFTVASEKGVPYLIDIEEQVGELCKKDIVQFSKTGENITQVHPGIDAYHFDIMSNLQTEAGRLIFFVSFHADILANLVKAIEIPNHRLELVIQNERTLLEISRDGARNKTPRNDYRLTDTETSRILATTPVEHSRWHAIDSHQPKLFSNYLKKILIENSVFLLISFVITAFFNYRIRQEEILRIMAENSRNDFLSIISHELRTPLTSIYGAISLLADKQLDINSDKSKTMLDIAKRNTSQLLHLVNEILDFRKIESGNVEYDFQPMELHSVIDEAIEGMQEYAKQFGTSINFKKYDSPVNVFIDRTRIIQVINNLLSNAIKYGAQNDSVSIDVTLADHMAKISFHDNGPGIPEEFTNKVFEKFSQANIRNKIKGSTGLGLNIARTFVNAHNGEINFTTSPQGTTFYFTLPVKED